MAAPHQGPDRTTEEIPVEPDNMKKQSLPTRDESSVSPPSPVDAADLGTSMVTANQSRSGSFGAANDHSIYPSNVYSPQAQAFYHEGFDNATGKRDDYPQFVNGEGLEIRPPGIYNDNHPVVFHTGYGYNPQMPYGPYSPVTPPLPPVGGDSQLYPPQQFSYSGTPYYQQLVSHSSPYINSSAPVSQPELLPLVSPDQQNDGVHFGPRPNYQPPLGSVSRGNFPGNSGTHDLQQGFDGFRSGGLWSDWSKPADRQRSFTPLSPTISPQLVGALGSFGNIGTASQQQRSLYGFGSGSNSYNRGYRGGSNWGSSFGSASFSNTGINGRGWLALDNSIRHGRGSSSLCSCNPMLDVLSEQNRGPRSSKPKNQNTTESNPQVENNKDGKSTVKSPDGLYNQVDFDTEYDDAKFFVIKSYSEDNVHKSIKYGVWASTPNGNRKLDAAYNEAKEKQGSCPIFFLFSVNASAHFCGVAEMVGPVDFDKSVDYWQQDKWSGQFPVKWHIIKDVPNSQFRHIILENNDNKPVTNSRDTQEVKLEQGIEMLKIFKNYETDLSILDDFNFYEERQKAIQEHKARHQSSLVGAGVVGGKEQETAVLSNDVMKQMSKTFAQVVRLDDRGSKEGLATDRNGSPSDSPPKAN